MKKTVTKVAVTGGVALATLGIGAGVASADTVHDQRPQNSSQFQRDQQQQTSADGFWFFGFWVALPH